MSEGKIVNSREKGKTGERELAQKLREYGYDTRRGQQYNGADGSADVEIWKDVPGYEGLYQASNTGKVRSLPKYNYNTTRILSQQVNKRDGRMSLYLCKNATHKRRIAVHRIVAITFIPNPNNYAEINHKDENPQNNNVENLEWCTRKYNMNYGTTPLRLNVKNKIEVEATDEKGNKMIFNSVRCAKIAGYDGAGIIMAIKTGKKYKSLYWRYANEH